jgi:acetyltransferase-like isoleucine patch superfamily enzyme
MLWFPRLLTKANSVWLKLAYPFAGFGRRVSIHHSCEIRRFYAHKIRIEDFVILDPDVWLNVPLISEASEPAILIGKGSNIGRRSVISARNRIELEENVLLAPAVYITDHNHEYSNIEVPVAGQGVTRGGRILIERNCWLGYGSMILGTKGDVVVGRNSVVGAYSIVTESCPPYSVVVGNPAKVVKRFDGASGKWLRVDESQRSRTESENEAVR